MESSWNLRLEDEAISWRIVTVYSKQENNKAKALTQWQISPSYGAKGAILRIRSVHRTMSCLIETHPIKRYRIFFNRITGYCETIEALCDWVKGVGFICWTCREQNVTCGQCILKSISRKHEIKCTFGITH